MYLNLQCRVGFNFAIYQMPTLYSASRQMMSWDWGSVVRKVRRSLDDSREEEEE